MKSGRGKLWDKKDHWPDNVWIEKDHYPNLYWCIIDNKTATGYDDLRLCGLYIENYLKEIKS